MFVCAVEITRLAELKRTAPGSELVNYEAGSPKPRALVICYGCWSLAVSDRWEAHDVGRMCLYVTIWRERISFRL